MFRVSFGYWFPALRAIIEGMAKAKLSVAFEELSGRAGTVVMVRDRGRQYLRALPSAKAGLSVGQAAAAERMARASRLWNAMGHDQAEAWNDYAGSRPGRAGARCTVGYNEFLRLATVALQADPTSVPALWPPDAPFLGERFVVAATAADGGVRFEAGGANSAGVATELLVQRLANPRRKAGDRYVSRGFVRFAPGGLSALVPLEAGTYVVGYRFVLVATGQVTGTVKLADRFSVG